MSLERLDPTRVTDATRGSSAIGPDEARGREFPRDRREQTVDGLDREVHGGGRVGDPVEPRQRAEIGPISTPVVAKTPDDSLEGALDRGVWFIQQADGPVPGTEVCDATPERFAIGPERRHVQGRSPSIDLQADGRHVRRGRSLPDPRLGLGGRRGDGRPVVCARSLAKGCRGGARWLATDRRGAARCRARRAPCPR